MKTKLLIFLSLILNGLDVDAQTTITIQPAANGKDALISSLPSETNLNFGAHPDLNALAWTNSGNPVVHRGLIDFDLSSIPSSASIISAYLSLYNNPTSSSNSGTHSSLSGTNQSYLRKITSAWNENTVTWNNQPPTSATNEVTLPQSIGGNDDYLNVDVTALIQDEFVNPSSNFGLMLELGTESYFRCLLFASSDYSDPTKHPKLVITYISTSSADTCITFQRGGASDIDALISSLASESNLNLGTHPDFNALAWTNSLSPVNHRGLIDFNVSSIPVGSAIVSAELNLYNNPASNSNSGAHSSLSGSNESVLQRIIAPWSPSTVTWNNQPSATNQNEVQVPQSTSPNQDYLNINVMNLVQDMVNNPGSSYGFLLKLVTESYYRCLLFASSDYWDISKQPTLSVCYNFPNSIAEIQSSLSFIKTFPNPASDIIHIEFNLSNNSNTSVKIYDINGQLIKTCFDGYLTSGNSKFEINVREEKLAASIYSIVVTTDKNIYTSNICVAE